MDRIDADREAVLRDLELEEQMEMRPVCNFCGEHITDECYYEIKDEVICQKCLDEHRVWLD